MEDTRGFIHHIYTVSTSHKWIVQVFSRINCLCVRCTIIFRIWLLLYSSLRASPRPSTSSTSGSSIVPHYSLPISWLSALALRCTLPVHCWVYLRTWSEGVLSLTLPECRIYSSPATSISICSFCRLAFLRIDTITTRTRGMVMLLAYSKLNTIRRLVFGCRQIVLFVY